MGGFALFALVSGGFVVALLAFLTSALTMMLLMLAIASLVATTQNILLQRLKHATPIIERLGGALLAAVGGFLIFSAVFVSTFRRIFF